MWQVTGDRWQVTCDTWHMTCDMYGRVNILSKFQLPSSYRLWFMILGRSGGKGSLTEWMNEWMNHVAVYRTAPATPGLLNMQTDLNSTFFLSYGLFYTLKISVTLKTTVESIALMFIWIQMSGKKVIKEFSNFWTLKKSALWTIWEFLHSGQIHNFYILQHSRFFMFWTIQEVLNHSVISTFWNIP